MATFTHNGHDYPVTDAVKDVVKTYVEEYNENVTQVAVDGNDLIVRGVRNINQDELLVPTELDTYETQYSIPALLETSPATPDIIADTNLTPTDTDH